MHGFEQSCPATSSCWIGLASVSSGTFANSATEESVSSNSKLLPRDPTGQPQGPNLDNKLRNTYRPVPGALAQTFALMPFMHRTSGMPVFSV